MDHLLLPNDRILFHLLYRFADSYFFYRNVGRRKNVHRLLHPLLVRNIASFINMTKLRLFATLPFDIKQINQVFRWFSHLRESIVPYLTLSLLSVFSKMRVNSYLLYNSQEPNPNYITLR